MRFIHSASTTMIFKAVALVGGLGTSVIISRILGSEGRGVYGGYFLLPVCSWTGNQIALKSLGCLIEER